LESNNLSYGRIKDAVDEIQDYINEKPKKDKSEKKKTDHKESKSVTKQYKEILNRLDKQD
jgi:chromatin segregation and condensation protein Rec8/ScpA/Scc1 (kleisin family)